MSSHRTSVDGNQPRSVSRPFSSFVLLLLGVALMSMLSPGLLSGQGRSPYESQRVDAKTLEAAIVAIGRTDPKEVVKLRLILLESSQNRCVGSKPRLVIRCFVELASALCTRSSPKNPSERSKTIADADCKRIADVVATNLLGEPSFVSSDKRARLVETAAVFRHALDAELEGQYARLALAMLAFESSTSKPKRRGRVKARQSATAAAAADAELIHRFCKSRGHAGQLAYQRCAAALVWFTSTESVHFPDGKRKEAKTP